MLYLVGGCSRSGKSLLAHRMRDRHGVPWFPLDALKMGLHLGAASPGIDPDDDDLATADLMRPIVEGMLDHLIFDGRDYLVEGNNLRPATVARYIPDTDEPVRACFLGYPDVAIDTKVADLARYTGVPADWLHRTGPDNVRRYLTTGRSLSRRLRDDCAAVGLPFVDTGADFQAGLATAARLLIDPAAHRG